MPITTERANKKQEFTTSFQFLLFPPFQFIHICMIFCLWYRPFKIVKEKTFSNLMTFNFFSPYQKQHIDFDKEYIFSKEFRTMIFYLRMFCRSQIMSVRLNTHTLNGLFSIFKFEIIICKT